MLQFLHVVVFYIAYFGKCYWFHSLSSNILASVRSCSCVSSIIPRYIKVIDVSITASEAIVRFLRDSTVDRDDLAETLEISFGLADRLFSCELITDEQLEEIQIRTTEKSRSRQLLTILKEVSWDNAACAQFVQALVDTCQQHVANYILRQSGSIGFLLYFAVMMFTTKSTE